MPGGCVPAKATALVVGAEAPFVPGVDCQCAWGLRTGEGYRIAEAPFVPGVDLIGLRKYVDCMESKLDYALLCLLDCCYTCILMGRWSMAWS